ncbi:MAG: hypothetical protein V4819_02595 [Verrucomicrobiota bacterium]
MKSQLKHAPLALALLSILDAQFSTAHAQGSLAPPGIPAPTMKTLDQIEPRTPITNTGAFTISAAGSYYLTTNLTVSTGDAITINADNVTLDLNGFTIFSTAPSANGTAILLNNGRANIAIHNGHIQSGVVTDGSGAFSGSGFANGIYGSSSLPIIKNVRVANVSVEGCLASGIFIGGLIGSVVESCTVNIAGDYGIGADTILNSTAIACGSTAISAIQASSCRGESINGSGVSATVAQNCYGKTTLGVGGISANTANDCRGESTSPTGWGLSASIAQNCYGSCSGNSYGVFAAFSANNCYGVSASGYGLLVTNIFTGAGGTAQNCFGIAANGTGLSAGIAQNCVGSGIIGLNADSADNCKGTGTTGVGVSVTGSANNCTGVSASGTGLLATTGGVAVATATGCRGTSTSGTGLSANTALNCAGTSGTGTGLSADMAENCYGVSSGSGTGLRAFGSAIGSYGRNYSNGTGLDAYIANSSRGTSLSGAAVLVSFKYNMP